MKSTFKIGSIEVQGVKLNDIEFSQEYTAQDAINLTFAGKSFVKGLLKEIPEMLEDLDSAFSKIEEVESRKEAEEIKEAKETGFAAMMPGLKINGKMVSFEELPEDLQAMVLHMQKRVVRR